MEQDRSEEHAHFLKWLLEKIEERGPDLLIIAGDIFDSANPPQQALTQYYQFLAGVSRTPTQVLVLGGNHDSALTLNAPRELLRALRIRVVGSAPEDHREALIDLDDAVVCAIPFLRERDVRRASAGQSFRQVAAQIREGILKHYRAVFDHACAVANGRPLIATGHLTAVGVKNSGSERAIQIGNLGAVPADCFSGFTYIALGHLHQPQNVGGQDHIRYSGSPIALGFDEVDTPKEILFVTTNRGREEAQIESIAVPSIRRLLRISCRMAELEKRLQRVPPVLGELSPWIELTVEDGMGQADLHHRVRDLSKDKAGVVLKIVTPRAVATADGHGRFRGRTLAEISPEEVFAERMRREGIALDSAEAHELAGTFSELLSKIQEASGK